MCTAPEDVPTTSEDQPGSKPDAGLARPKKAAEKRPGLKKARALPEEAAAGEGFAPSDLPRAFGRYVLLRRIARGGMGEVFLACTMGIEGAERPVVVKLIRREHLGDRSFLARFLDEARVQAQLSHRGVAQVLEAATDKSTGEPYVVVEYVDGRSLGDLRSRSIQVGERIDWVEAVSIAIMIAEALGYVHDRRDVGGGPLGIVHRDLSPQNVMLSFDGDAKIIDFGTARGQNRRCHTVAGVVFAKPGYVAPEVANGDSGDGRVDLYALGIMLWELCMGRRFLQGESADHMALVSKNELDPPPLSERLGAPSGLDEIIAKLTAHNRDDRYSSGADAARDLARLLTDLPSLPGGERSVRARARDLMTRLFADEPNRMRKAFVRLIAAARPIATAARNHTTAPSPANFAEDESRGILPGTRYRIVEEIGRGATSVVYKAEHVDLGRVVALKVLDGAMTQSADFADRLRREAQTLSKLAHPNLVTLHDFGRSADGRLFCVMELCAGETLAAYLAREKPIEIAEALRFTGQILSALEVAHEAGVIHRDIKPENVLVTDEGQLKLLDFGLAASAAELEMESDAADKPVLSGVTLFGTPEYMAPEQATGGKLDGRADIYAVGCVLYEMLTGTLPFQHDSSVGLLEAKIKGSPERARDRAAERGISEELDEFCNRAIARHPSLRFQTVTEMRELVDALLAEPPPRRTRGRAMAGIGGLAAVALAALLAIPRFGGDLTAVTSYLSADLATAAVSSGEETKPSEGAESPVAPGEVAPSKPMPHASLAAQLARPEPVAAQKPVDDAANESLASVDDDQPLEDSASVDERDPAEEADAVDDSPAMAEADEADDSQDDAPKSAAKAPNKSSSPKASSAPKKVAAAGDAPKNRRAGTKKASTSTKKKRVSTSAKRVK